MSNDILVTTVVLWSYQISVIIPAVVLVVTSIVVILKLPEYFRIKKLIKGWEDD